LSEFAPKSRNSVNSQHGIILSVPQQSTTS
jgi:hypothetical protein